MKKDTLNLAEAIEILEQFENDPKAQKCLKIYQGLSENKRNILLIAMDAFALGIKAGTQIGV